MKAKRLSRWRLSMRANLALFFLSGIGLFLASLALPPIAAWAVLEYIEDVPKAGVYTGWGVGWLVLPFVSVWVNRSLFGRLIPARCKSCSGRAYIATRRAKRFDRWVEGRNVREYVFLCRDCGYDHVTGIRGGVRREQG